MDGYAPNSANSYKIGSDPFSDKLISASSGHIYGHGCFLGSN